MGFGLLYFWFFVFAFMFLLFLSSPVSDIRDVDAMKPAGEWNGTGGGGCIYRRAGITWAAGNGFKLQAYPCLSSVTKFQVTSNREFGSPEACPKPVHGALVIPPPQCCTVPSPIPLTDGCTYPLASLISKILM